MKSIITPAIIFYVFLIINISYLIKNRIFEIITNTSYFDSLKYLLGSAIYFFTNINILIYCSFKNHCSDIYIMLTLIAVVIGTVIYLIHLIKKTFHSIKQLLNGELTDLIPAFYGIIYIKLLYDIIYASYFLGFNSLHMLENKMLIVLVYPFFIIISELSIKVKSFSNTVIN